MDTYRNVPDYVRLAALFILIVPVQAQTTAVVTAQFDNSRTGANLNEKILNTSNVSSASFGKLYSFPVDGYVYGQPLYVPGLRIGGGTADVLYVVTMHNSVYAFDANNASRPPLFHVSLGTPVPATGGAVCPDNGTTGPELGILSTPVIDIQSGTLYAVSATPASGGGYVHQLFALDITTGLNKLNPVVISATVPGRGPDAQNGQVALNHLKYIQRPGLLLANGTVYAGFGSCGPDPAPYHGWLIGYNASTLQQSAVFNTSPNGDEAAIWQSGRGLVSDASGAVYVTTGNGTWNGATEFADSILKLSPSGTLQDWFTPSNYGPLDQYDLDLSSSGPALMPDSNLMVDGGKEGIVYVLNPSSLGHLGGPVQQFQATQACTLSFNGCHQIHSIAYWNNGFNPMLYVWGVNDTLRSYTASNGHFNTTATSQSSTTASYPGGILAVSSSGTQQGTGILWALTPPGVLRAFDAANVARELWNSTQNSARDSVGRLAKFGQVTIANGKVFVPTFSNTVGVYGLLAAPPITPTGLTFTVDFGASGQVSLTWTDNSKDESGFSIERSQDGVNFTQITTVAANITSYTDTNVSQYVWYYYRVRAFNSAGYSGYSNAAAYFVI